MAIILTKQPEKYTPASNPIVFSVSGSSNSIYYTVELQEEKTLGTIFSGKIYPFAQSPDTASVNLSQQLQSLVRSQVDNTDDYILGKPKNVIGYKVKFTDYGLSATTATTISALSTGLTTDTFYAFEGKLDILNYTNDWSVDKYVVTSASTDTRFLTYQPQFKCVNEYSTEHLYFLQDLDKLELVNVFEVGKTTGNTITIKILEGNQIGDNITINISDSLGSLTIASYTATSNNVNSEYIANVLYDKMMFQSFQFTILRFIYGIDVQLNGDTITITQSTDPLVPYFDFNVVYTPSTTCFTGNTEAIAYIYGDVLNELTNDYPTSFYFEMPSFDEEFGFYYGGSPVFEVDSITTSDLVDELVNKGNTEGLGQAIPSLLLTFTKTSNSTFEVKYFNHTGAEINGNLFRIRLYSESTSEENYDFAFTGGTTNINTKSSVVITGITTPLVIPETPDYISWDDSVYGFVNVYYIPNLGDTVNLNTYITNFVNAANNSATSTVLGYEFLKQGTDIKVISPLGQIQNGQSLEFANAGNTTLTGFTFSGGIDSVGCITTEIIKNDLTKVKAGDSIFFTAFTEMFQSQVIVETEQPEVRAEAVITITGTSAVGDNVCFSAITSGGTTPLFCYTNQNSAYTTTDIAREIGNVFTLGNGELGGGYTGQWNGDNTVSIFAPVGLGLSGNDIIIAGSLDVISSTGDLPATPPTAIISGIGTPVSSGLTTSCFTIDIELGGIVFPSYTTTSSDILNVSGFVSNVVAAINTNTSGYTAEQIAEDAFSMSARTGLGASQNNFYLSFSDGARFYSSSWTGGTNSGVTYHDEIRYSINQFSGGQDFIDNITGYSEDRMIRLNVSPRKLIEKGLDFVDNEVYKIYLIDTSGNTLTQEFKYKWCPAECNQDYVNILWTNSLGGVDSYQFIAPQVVHNSFKSSIKKNNNNLYSSTPYITNGVYNQTNEVYSNNTKTSFTVWTKNLSDEESDWLIELLNSKNIYVELSNHQLVPVNLTTTDYTVKKKKMYKNEFISYSFTFEFDNNYHEPLSINGRLRINS